MAKLLRFVGFLLRFLLDLLQGIVLLDLLQKIDREFFVGLNAYISCNDICIYQPVGDRRICLFLFPYFYS